MFGKIVGAERLKKILINDKHFQPSRFNDLIKSEIFRCLSSYMEIAPENVMTNISIDEEGNYVLRCKVKCKRLKIMGILPSEV